MDFSELFHGKHSIFSPNGKFLACLCGDFVEIRYADTLLKAFKFECRDVVKVVKWSGDSSLLLCDAGLNKLKVFSMNSGSCLASLKQPSGAICQIVWAADSRSILYSEPLLFRVVIWKLCIEYGQLGLEYIENVQPWAKPGSALSPNGRHLAVVICGLMNGIDILEEASDSKNEAEIKSDSISIFSTISWRKEISIVCKGIQRVGGLVWSSNSNTIAVWPMDPPDPVLIICSRSGSLLGKWQPSDKLWPGVCHVKFSPSAQFMTIVNRNSKVHILNCVAWCEELELDHNSSIAGDNCKVYREVLRCDEENPLFVEVLERPVSISIISSLVKAKRTSRAAWSSGGRYVASCLALAPAVVWIWSAAQSFNLCCVIVMKHQVQDFSWDPVQNILAVVDGEDCVILWNADDEKLDCASICTPVSRMLFQSNHLNWRSDGKALVVSSDQNSAVLELPGTKNR